MIGVIGGSGIYEFSGLRIIEDRQIQTPFGEPSAPYKIGEFSDTQIAFLPRHGILHTIPPHKINYRANLWGFKMLGVEHIISVNAVGGINPKLKPHDIVLMEQVIDLTQGMRQSTFYDSDEVVHVDFTEPYCHELNAHILSAALKAGIGQLNTVAYICVNGPRLESSAEIRFFGGIGADVVGMTGMPEACLARELEICFSGIAVVTNHAAGISGKKLLAVEAVRIMKESSEKIKALLKETFPLIPSERLCKCKESLKDSRL